jgi:spore germination protein KA/spore germination protein
MDALPSHYVISLAEMRIGVPFPPIVGAFLLEFLMELLREALLRVPKQIGSAVGIVSAIVIGQAAISAGIFSPLLLILATAGLLASFVMPDFALANVMRVIKIAALLSTAILGFYGLVLFTCALLAHLISTESFGVPYFSPLAPFNRYDFLRSFIFNISFSPYRPKNLRDKDTTRARTRPRR